jgi:hypothetical protein
MFRVPVWYRDMFWEWCEKNNITCEYQGTEKIGPQFAAKAYDTWYIDNEKDRIFAMLRWS